MTEQAADAIVGSVSLLAALAILASVPWRRRRRDLTRLTRFQRLLAAAVRR